MITTLDLGSIALSEEQLNLLDRYAQLLLDWNKKIRLTGYSTVEEIRQHLILESCLSLALLRNRPLRNIIDFGSGNGTPGLLFALLDPTLSLTLLERIEKKRVFMEYAATKLGIKNIRISPSLPSPESNPVIFMKAITLANLFSDSAIMKLALPPWTLFRFGSDTHSSCFPVSSYVINGDITAWGISGSVTLTESVYKG